MTDQEEAPRRMTANGAVLELYRITGTTDPDGLVGTVQALVDGQEQGGKVEALNAQLVTAQERNDTLQRQLGEAAIANKDLTLQLAEAKAALEAVGK